MAKRQFKLSENQTIPMREVDVPGSGELWVPRHIQRIDIWPENKSATHGWQVRLREHGTRFFSDGEKSPTISLKAAQTFLKENYKSIPPASRIADKERSSKQTKTGAAGVTIIFRQARNRHAYEAYFSVTAPVWHSKPRVLKIYIATNNSITQDKLDDAYSKAVYLRQLAEKYYSTQDTLNGLGLRPAKAGKRVKPIKCPISINKAIRLIKQKQAA